MRIAAQKGDAPRRKVGEEARIVVRLWYRYTKRVVRRQRETPMLESAVAAVAAVSGISVSTAEARKNQPELREIAAALTWQIDENRFADARHAIEAVDRV